MTLTPLVAFAQKLVHTPSLSGEERDAAQIVYAEMEALGFDHAYFDANGSVIGWIDGAVPGPVLLLDAHLDTVGIAPGSRWAHPPFGGEIADGFLYGRGIADMKGALAAMLHAAASLDRQKLAGRVVVSATVMEEVLEGVALQPVIETLAPHFVVIGEATQLKINTGGRGRAEISIETTGQPAHSSSPHLGVNAVHLMMQVIAAIERLPSPSHPVLGEGIMALTDIISEPYPGHSVLPSRCRVTYDRRLLPGETAQSVLAALNHLPDLQGIPYQAALAHGAYVTYTRVPLESDKFFPAWALDETHPFVQASLRGIQSAGLPAQTGTYRFCTNAAYSAGVAGIPTIGFGPGAEGDAHVVDERLALSDLEAAMRGYAGIINAVLAPQPR